jgi:hypothetical protein
MERKRWTPKTEITEELLLFREKRKWQIALRRYVFDKNASVAYAPYFGLDIPYFRKWIELQFDGEMNWKNFSLAWQFDHIIPMGHFNFNEEKDLRLCWNFTNIRAEKLSKGAKSAQKGVVLAAKAHFSTLLNFTGYAVCREMIQKIEAIEKEQEIKSADLNGFLLENKERIESLLTFTPAEFANLHSGAEINQVLEERNFLKKYG